MANTWFITAKDNMWDSPYNDHNPYRKSLCYECQNFSYVDDGCVSIDGKLFFCCKECLEAFLIQEEM